MRTPWIYSLIIAAGMLLCGTAMAAPQKYHKVQLISPETPQSWSYGSMTNHRLLWDAEKKTFRAELTFSDELYSSDVNPSPERETYECPFPGVTWDEASGQFLAKTAKGFSVPVARRVKMLFGTQIELLPTARVEIFNVHGRLIVVLSATTNPAFATGQNKWIVRPQGWYLQNLF